MKRLVAAALSVFASCAFVTAAQAQLGDEIVVTGSRLQRYSSDVVPTVALKRNADFVLVSYQFICDTRDAAQRKKELTKTLQSLIAAADKRKDIDLSTLVEYDDNYDTLYFPKPYTSVNDDGFYGQPGRLDTSVQRLVIKTPVDGKIKSLEDAVERIESFVESVKMEGRTLAVDDNEAQLSVVNVERYRGELTAAIGADAKAQGAALNATETEIEGMEQVVRWERTGPLELKIYIPYKYAFTIGN
ncbi:MAG: hypothetical protein R3C58_00070 [Parvularculaceae bacterium]